MFQLGVAVESMWPLSLKSYAALVKNWRILGGIRYCWVEANCERNGSTLHTLGLKKKGEFGWKVPWGIRLKNILI